MLRVSLLFLLVCIMGLFIEAAVVHASFPHAIAPDFTLVLVVILALYYQTVTGVLGAFFLGLLSDFASGQFVGPNAAGSVIVFCLVGMIASRVYAERSIAVLLITFICSLMKSATFIMMQILYVDNAFAQIFRLEIGKLVLWEALLSALVAPIVLRLLVWSRQLSHHSRNPGRASFGRWQESR